MTEISILDSRLLDKTSAIAPSFPSAKNRSDACRAPSLFIEIEWVYSLLPGPSMLTKSGDHEEEGEF